MKRITVIFLICLSITLSACSGGAVVFAPTAPPPDLSPLRYQHPSGAFSLVVPRQWAVHEQNTTTLASASFSRPGEDEPVLLVSVVNPSGVQADSQGFAQLIQQYQSQVRPDIERYTESNRQAMGDGSWRMTGLRRTAAGQTQQVNTFIQREGALLAIMDVIVSDVSPLDDVLTVINTFSFNADVASLQPAPLTTLNSASRAALSLLHVSAWTTPNGVFFVTGEVANYGPTVAASLPVQVTLRTADGLNVAEAADTVMGHGILPGGFAPFSLRFGQGQPAMSTSYEVRLGAGWEAPNVRLTDPSMMTWTDESVYQDGLLSISGTITNMSDQPIREPRAVATVFDSAQNVIAAGFDVADAPVLAPGESTRYGIGIPEIGGEPANYIVYVQGLLE
jgi:hypothetical protein